MLTHSGNSLPQSEHCIVAIGASAGGLEAIHEFFDNMPANGNLSFVIIQHLSPAYKSLLVELVSRHTHMEVFEATHDAAVQPNCVYVIPNNKLLSIKDGRLILSDKNFEKAPNTAIDFFLRSLAEERGSHAIAVILSGTGTDGTRGIGAIQNAGGMVLVQDPLTAKFDGMPNSAIATGHADYILAPELMPEEIFNYIRERPVHLGGEGRPDENLLPEVLRLVEKYCHHDFFNYKTPTILRRIGRRMAQLNYQDFSDYLSHLCASPEECRVLGKEFLIGVTKFFRDHAAFRILRDEVLHELVRSKEENEILKIWVTACSTGEEAYSIAILLDDLLQNMKKDLEVKIFATDIDSEAIEYASRGSYPLQSVLEIEDRLVKKYFVREGGNVNIIPDLRKQIVFARHDILKDPPFIKNDLVTCRNMLIYMNNNLQRRVLATLQFSLSLGGYLFLGPSEIPAAISESLREINGKWKIYRKDSSEFRYFPDRFPTSRNFKTHQEVRTTVQQAVTTRALADDFRDLLTQEFGFAAIYIDRNFEVKDAIGEFRKYLSLPDRIVNLQLLKMVEPELSVALNTAVRKAVKGNNCVHLHPIRIKREDTEQLVNIFVKPASREGYITIVFNEAREVATGRTVTEFEPGSPEALSYITELEDELKETRMNLQMAIENMETANEELQSSNEELLSANEELQSGNEELQSLNEELHTLNTEHQLRIRELIELNDDLNNYFRSSEIAQIFVDRNYCIKKFNPVAVRMVNLIDSDIGRPIEHISNNIRNTRLQEDISRVIRTGNMIEREVELSNDSICLMKMLPYIRQDQATDGVVISFVDISMVKQLDTMIKGVFNASHNAIIAFRSMEGVNGLEDFKIIAANSTAMALFRLPAGDIEECTILQNLPQGARDAIFEYCATVFSGGRPLQTEIEMNSDTALNVYLCNATRMTSGVVVTLTDITGKKQAEKKLKEHLAELEQIKESYRKLSIELEEKVAERTQEFRFVTDFMPQMVWATRPDGYHEFYNKQWYDYTGLSYEESKDRGWNEVLHPDDQQRAWKIWSHALKTGGPYEIEYRFRRYDGEFRWFLGRALPLRDDQGRIIKWFGTCTDIHDQKLMSDILEKKVQERTEELQRINAELEASNHELLQFASVASHDLKEPLRKIHMFANLIKDRYMMEMAGGADEFMDRIIKASARMTRLINDLLTFTRLSVNSRSELVDLNIVMEEVLSDLELAIQEKKAIIETDILPKAEIVNGQMRQVFQNLISNSLKFSKPGQLPHINVKSCLVKACSFDAMPDPDGEYCRIEFRDNGIGFDSQYSNRIFNLFQRLHGREKYEGTGIGLAITRKIVEKHNGIITAMGKENEGATFIIVLPLRQQAEVAQSLMDQSA